MHEKNFVEFGGAGGREVVGGISYSTLDIVAGHFGFAFDPVFYDKWFEYSGGGSIGGSLGSVKEITLFLGKRALNRRPRC